MKKKRTYNLSEKIIVAIIAVLCLIIIYPFYYVLIVSFSSVKALNTHVPYLLPYTIDLEGYKAVFQDKHMLSSLRNSIIVTVIGVGLNMLLSLMGAYVLSKKTLMGRKLFLSLIIFTMLFNGGLVPYYLVVTGLGLKNVIWSMILPTGINTFYLIIMKNYFASLPQSLEESAKIDGANDIVILTKIIIPIAMPFVATFFLFYAVERWNEWWNAMLFINKKSLMPLQINLREILINYSSQLATQAQLIISSNQKSNMQAVQMASIVVATVPIICVYPFIQKHFVKGVMVGSIKE